MRDVVSATSEKCHFCDQLGVVHLCTEIGEWWVCLTHARPWGYNAKKSRVIEDDSANVGPDSDADY